MAAAIAYRGLHGRVRHMVIGQIDPCVAWSTELYLVPRTYMRDCLS